MNCDHNTLVAFIIFVYWCYQGRPAPNVFQDVAFLPSRASFPPHFLDIVVVVNALGPPHVLRLWLGVSNSILPVKYFRSNKASFYVR